jgi:hypothetical protein
MMVLIMLAGLLFVGCTDANVYTATGAEPFRPDRIAVPGRLCTEDTTGSKFPVKVLIMVDTSYAMFSGDPEYYRFSGPGSVPAPGSINAFIDRMRNQQNVSLGFAGISSVARPVAPVPPAFCQPPPCDAQQFFPVRDVDGGLVESQLATATGGERDLANAISQAESFITADMARASAGEILRSRYLVFMLLAGPPTNSDLARLATQVEDLKKFVYSKGALEFRLHIGCLFFGQESIDPRPAGFACHAEAGTVSCTCGGACSGTHSDNYCAACCAIAAGPPGYADWDAYNDAARDIYSSMAFAGDGLLREFECPASIEFRLNASTTSVRLKRKDIVAYNINSRLTVDGPVQDSDGDGLLDSEELEATPATLPDTWDSDGDGLSDRLEFRAFPRQNPMDNTDRPASCPDPAVLGIIPDQDLDMLNDCEEGLIQTSPSIPDTDGDGLPDALEFMSGTVPTAAADRLLDFDGDGIFNAQEVLEHTNPRANDGRLRGTEAYRTSITDLGIRTVATMEDLPELRAVTFRSASANVAGGAGLLRFTPGNPGTLEWSDARWQVPPPFAPVPQEIDRGTGEYTLYAENAMTGEQISVVVFVVEQWLPSTAVTVYPHISISERNCYDVRISNIKLVQTLAAETMLQPGSRHAEGTNHILIFFTQAPEDRLDSPGISKVAELPVIYRCTDPDVADSCARDPDSGFVQLSDADFAASVP